MGRNSRRKTKSAKTQKKNGNRNTIVIAAILVVAIGYWGISQLGASGYPVVVKGVFYDQAVVSNETGKVTVPTEVVENNKLVFVDVKLANPTGEFTYLGRNIILSSYRGGEYLPLIFISTPNGNTIGGVRVCEPCSSFSFHIIDRKYLQCDACGTRWNIETLTGVSGGCMGYPPPKLTTGIIDGVVVEAGQTGLSLQA